MIKFVIIWICLPLCAFGQVSDTTYIDEAYRIVSSKEFYKKAKSNLYYTNLYIADTTIYNKIFLKYYIGELEEEKRVQLFSLLSQRNAIDTTKSILIHYKDTLHSKDHYPKKDTVIKYKDGSHKHIISYRTFLRQHRQCEKQYSSKNIQMYHFINFNNGHPLEVKKLKWRKDPLNILRRMFYNHSDNMRFWTILIHPNGEYAINNAGVRTIKMWKEMKMHKNWHLYKEQFYNSYHTLNPELKKNDHP